MFEQLVDIICNYVEIEQETSSRNHVLWKILDSHPLIL